MNNAFLLSFLVKPCLLFLTDFIRKKIILFDDTNTHTYTHIHINVNFKCMLRYNFLKNAPIFIILFLLKKAKVHDGTVVKKFTVR